MEVSIRDFRRSDAQAIHAIHTECLTRSLLGSYDPGQIAAWMRGRTPRGYVVAWRRGESIRVAESGGRVVGYASWSRDELLSLFVVPGSQRSGVGTDLALGCMRSAASSGTPLARVSAALGAEGFYRRLGFVEAGRGHAVRNGVAIPETRMVARASA